jgi:hypothetical protein
MPLTLVPSSPAVDSDCAASSSSALSDHAVPVDRASSVCRRVARLARFEELAPGELVEFLGEPPVA